MVEVMLITDATFRKMKILFITCSVLILIEFIVLIVCAISHTIITDDDYDDPFLYDAENDVTVVTFICLLVTGIFWIASLVYLLERISRKHKSLQIV